MNNRFVKVVYLDQKYTKVVLGNLISEDSVFVTIESNKGTIRLNKTSITSIKEVKE